MDRPVWAVIIRAWRPRWWSSPSSWCDGTNRFLRSKACRCSLRYVPTKSFSRSRWSEVRRWSGTWHILVELRCWWMTSQWSWRVGHHRICSRAGLTWIILPSRRVSPGWRILRDWRVLRCRWILPTAWTRPGRRKPTGGHIPSRR